MPIVNPTLPNDGEDADAADISGPIAAILAVLNGHIDEDNLEDGGVILSKLSAAVQGLLVPTGVFLPYGGTTAPSSAWLLCAGQAVSRSTYSALFAILGTAFGAGDGSTTFNLPDFRGRTAVGIDNLGGSAANRIQKSTTITTTNASATATVASASGLAVGMFVTSANVPAGTTISAISGTTLTLSANATATAAGVAARFSLLGNDAQSIGAAGGEQTHVQLEAEMAAHSHSLLETYSSDTGSGTNSIQRASVASGDSSTNSAGNTNTKGSSNPTPNVQPSLATNWIVKI